MNLLGLTITRTKAQTDLPPLTPVSSNRGWWPVIRESFSGAWQQNVTVSLVDVLQHPTVFACVTLIASDIAKMRLRLVALDSDGIWTETESAAFSPVLRKPNRYQTRITFIKSWLISKLAYGNAYIAKERDQRGIVTALYVLDPNRVTPLVAPDGSVYYQLGRDDLAQQPEDYAVVPAKEIIHDIMHPLYHPLVGLSPIYACGVSATLGLKLQTNSTKFFENMSRPSGMLTAPGAISDETALRLKTTFEAAVSGVNMGRIVMSGDGLEFTPFTMTAVDSQLTEQWEASAKAVCSTYRVPAYKVGVEPPPSYNNIEALDRQYYSQCLQELIEGIELLLDEGLELPKPYGTEFDLDDLLRMDTATQVNTLAAEVGSAIASPNEARKARNRPPMKGGEEPILQQQYWPMHQIVERPMPTDARPAPDPNDADDEADDADLAASFGPILRRKALEAGLSAG